MTYSVILYVVALDLDLIFEGERFKSRIFWSIKRNYLTNFDRATITIANTGIHILAFNWYIYISLWSILKATAKVTQI